MSETPQVLKEPEVTLDPPSAEWLTEAEHLIAGWERQRFSRLLHAGLSQSLSGAQLMVSVLEKQVRAECPEHLADVQAFAEKLRKVSLIVRSLPPEKEEAGGAS
jgi:signal transduction histidine kinase